MDYRRGPIRRRQRAGKSGVDLSGIDGWFAGLGQCGAPMRLGDGVSLAEGQLMMI